jgi:phage tail-like protein
VKQAQIKRLLPSVFQRTVRAANPLLAILDVMEAMHAPSESALDNLDTTFDPHRTPDQFVPYLASWVDLEILLDVPRGGSSSSASLSTGLGRLRELAAAAVSLSQWRGTRKGLQLFLETATGRQEFEIKEQVIGADGRPNPFHLQISAPGDLAQHRTLIEKIIELEKPAYVTYELAFGLPDHSTGTTT